MHANMLDMYHGDDNDAVPDFAALKNEGYIILAHKATQGSNYRDPKFLARVIAASKAGMLIIAYHFGDGSDVTNQTANFFAACYDARQSVASLWECLDFEQNASSQMSASQAKIFLSEMGAPILYGSDLPRENAKEFAAHLPWLWLAEYGPHENIPAPWTATTTPFWQYSETGVVGGVRGHVDLNVCSWTQDQLAAQWGKPCSTA